MFAVEPLIVSVYPECWNYREPDPEEFASWTVLIRHRS